MDTHDLRLKLLPELRQNSRFSQTLAKGVLHEDTSDYLTYHLMRIAKMDSATHRSFEYEMGGLTPDASFVVDGTRVIVEAKTKASPQKQLRRYMQKYMEAMAPEVIGVALTFGDYQIECTGDVPHTTLMKVRKIVAALYYFIDREFKRKDLFPEFYQVHTSYPTPPRKLYEAVVPKWA